ncbi:MAG: YggT family protein [Gemmatimonadales bacterium]
MGDVLTLAVVHGARLLVAGAFVLSAIVALTHASVRRGTLSAFGGWARFVRRWSDPMLVPVERRLARAGANPQDAPWWLVGGVVVGGLAFIALVDWLVGFIYTMYATAATGQLLLLLIHSVFELLRVAIIILVIASWIQLSPYSKFMRVVHGLTDWLIDPIRRVLPPFGVFDLSPIAAYFILYLAEQLVMRGFF